MGTGVGTKVVVNGHELTEDELDAYENADVNRAQAMRKFHATRKQQEPSLGQWNAGLSKSTRAPKRVRQFSGPETPIRIRIK